MLPKLEEIRIYFNQKGVPQEEADKFYRFYEKRKWKTPKGIAITKWTDKARVWAYDILQHKRR
jgi:hypothetical protein